MLQYTILYCIALHYMMSLREDEGAVPQQDPLDPDAEHLPVWSFMI